MLHSEFRDGNIPAGHQQQRLLQESLDQVPEGMESFCESRGVLRAQLGRTQQKRTACRFVATRVLRRRQLALPGHEETKEEQDSGETPRGERYKIRGTGTNRTIDGIELIVWYRQRCGKSEEVHSVMKEDQAGGQLLSGDFGENAAWWAIMILTLHLNAAMKRLVLLQGWAMRRLKALRFGLINQAAVVRGRSRQLQILLPAFDLLLMARNRIAQLARGRHHRCPRSDWANPIREQGSHRQVCPKFTHFPPTQTKRVCVGTMAALANWKI